MSKRHPHYNPKEILARAQRALHPDEKTANKATQAQANMQKETMVSKFKFDTKTILLAAGAIVVGSLALRLVTRKSGFVGLGIPVLIGVSVHQILTKGSPEETLAIRPDNATVH